MRHFPHVVELWEEVEWCLAMLSMIVEELATARATKGGTADDDPLGELARHIVSVMPNLIKTVLLVSGQERARPILSSPLFGRIYLCPEAIGPWLTMMLCQRKTSKNAIGVGIPPSGRAIDFLEFVSQTTVTDFVGLPDSDGDQAASIEPHDVDEFLLTKVSTLNQAQTYPTKLLV